MLNPNNTLRGWLSTAAVISAALVLYLVTALIGAAVTGSSVAGAALSNAALFVAGVFWMRSERGRHTTGLQVGLRRAYGRGKGFWGLVVAAVAFSWLAGQTASSWIYSYAGSAGFDTHARTMDSAPVLLVLLVVLVLAPMGEEMLMRGVAYARVRRHLPPLAAALITSGIFSLMHLNLVQILVTLPLGLVLAAVYEQTGRITPVVLIHAVFNLLSVVVPVQFVSGLSSLTFVLLSGVVLALILVRLYKSLTTAPEGASEPLSASAGTPEPAR